MLPTKHLPVQASLAHLKYQARDLAKAATAGDPDALQRLIDHQPDFAGLTPAEAAARPIKLSDAQLVVAREYGYASWPKLKNAVRPTERNGYTRIINPDFAHNEERAHALLEQHKDALPFVLEQIKRCHPSYAGASASEIKAATLTDDDARLIYARDHGFDNWHALTAHLEALRNGQAEEPFAAAFEAIKAGDLDRLKELLATHPELISARGTNDNTLLNLAVGNRQPEASKILIEAGADADLPNNRGWSPLHAAGYGNWPELVEPLIRAGAKIDRFARGDGGTPLVMALFWGHREAAEELARFGIEPANLRAAAGVGRLDLVQSFFEPDGTLKQSAGEHRGFYRVHSGFPYWKPSNSRQEILDEAFTYACRSGRTQVLGFLLEMGADIDGDPYRGTGLIWAAAKGRLEAINWLLDHGAKIDHRGTFGGPDHGKGVTALHMAAGSGQLDAVKLLIEHGADATLRDELHGGPPIGWADFFGYPETRDYLGQSASIEDAAFFGYIDRVKRLLSEDPGLVNGAKREGAGSPLLRAVRGNHPEIVRLLLDHGADTEKTDSEGKTALDVALAEGYNDIAEILRRHASDRR